MKTINAYTNYCTQEQTNRAIKLGCPCESPEDYSPVKLPTTQQMIGWLREKRYFITPIVSHIRKLKYGFTLNDIKNGVKFKKQSIEWNTYEQAELAAIDAALDYLEKGETK